MRKFRLLFIILGAMYIQFKNQIWTKLDLFNLNDHSNDGIEKKNSNLQSRASVLKSPDYFEYIHLVFRHHERKILGNDLKHYPIAQKGSNVAENCQS